MTITLTLILVAVNIIVSFYAFGKPIVLNRLMMNPWNIKRKNQYERFITSGFIHQDHMHLIFNMFSLYFLGSAIEHDFIVLFGAKGYFYYFLLYMLAIIASDLPTYFKNQNNPSYNSLGASGGVAAVVFAFIILEPVQYLCIFIGLCMPGFIFGSIYLIYSYFQGKRANDNINHDAHIYGSLFGLVFCVIVYPACIPHFFNEVNQWLASIL